MWRMQILLGLLGHFNTFIAIHVPRGVITALLGICHSLRCLLARTGVSVASARHFLVPSSSSVEHLKERKAHYHFTPRPLDPPCPFCTFAFIEHLSRLRSRGKRQIVLERNIFKKQTWNEGLRDISQNAFRIHGYS